MTAAVEAKDAAVETDTDAVESGAATLDEIIAQRPMAEWAERFEAELARSRAAVEALRALAEEERRVRQHREAGRRVRRTPDCRSSGC